MCMLCLCFTTYVTDTQTQTHTHTHTHTQAHLAEGQSPLTDEDISPSKLEFLDLRGAINFEPLFGVGVERLRRFVEGNNEQDGIEASVVLEKTQKRRRLDESVEDVDSRQGKRRWRRCRWQISPMVAAATAILR